MIELLSVGISHEHDDKFFPFTKEQTSIRSMSNSVAPVKIKGGNEFTPCVCGAESRYSEKPRKG